jgi:hypothetical protein
MYIEQTPWPYSASELYRPSDRRFSAKLVQFLPIESVAWPAQRIHTAVISVFQTGTATFSFKKLLSCTHEAE